jgi:hydroxymethylglutaryl-CoA lyase
VATGVNIERLIAAREPLKNGLPGEALYGMTPLAGVPKGFVQGPVHG